MSDAFRPRRAWTAIASAIASMVVASMGACSPAAPPPSTPAPVASKAPPEGDRSGFAGAAFSSYHSARIGLTLPLPDKAAWQVSDLEAVAGGWLVLTHPPTGTVVRARRFDDVAPVVGVKECEQRAVTVGELPSAAEIEKRGYETLSDEALHRPKGWDGRRWVAFEPSSSGLAGHVYLISGRARACLVVHVLARVKGDHEAAALADRLELFASRVVGLVSVDQAAPPVTGLPAPP